MKNHINRPYANIKFTYRSDNELIGGVGKFHKCPDCNTLRTSGELNFEGRCHHNSPAICIDRKQCERAKRKNKK